MKTQEEKRKQWLEYYYAHREGINDKAKQRYRRDEAKRKQQSETNKRWRYTEAGREAKKRGKDQAHDRAMQFLNEHKQSHPCIVCGETDPVVLDFHHRNPADKQYNVMAMSRQGYSLKRIEEEVAKCDVICANDHRRLHNNPHVSSD